MEDQGGSKAPFHALGAGLVALLGGLATVADDCARAGAHLGGAADDLARVGAHADDVGGATGALDEFARVGGHLDDPARAGARAEIAAEVAGREGAHVSDELAGDLAELGLDAADIGLNVYDLVQDGAIAGDDRGPAAPTRTQAVSPRPRLVVAGVANAPAEGPVDPLVLLVEDTDDARVKRLAEGCVAVDRRCDVIACAPGAVGCKEAWRAAWDTLASDPALVGRSGAVWDALILEGSRRAATTGSRLVGATRTPTGIAWDVRRAP